MGDISTHGKKLDVKARIADNTDKKVFNWLLKKTSQKSMPFSQVIRIALRELYNKYNPEDKVEVQNIN